MRLPPMIGRYRVLERLGQGAMGVVYRGRDEALDRDVAVKVMLAEAVDEGSRARFQREARAAAKLQHPHIVTVYEMGEHDGAPFMAMELLEGQDLQRVMRTRALADPAVAVPIVLQVLEGLGHAHVRGIVHRDVKPSNVFLLEGRHAKILDFGVARLGEAMTVTGHVVGTPDYMSPEQVRAEPVDGRSDLFSTALILYEMVTGTKPYRPGSVMSVLYQIAHENADLSRFPATPEWAPLLAALRRALARDRDQRYADARAMAVDLAEGLRILGGAAPDRHPAVPEIEATVTHELSLSLPSAAVVAVASPAPVRDAMPAPLSRPEVQGTSVPSPRSRPRVQARVTRPLRPGHRGGRSLFAAAVIVGLAAAAGGLWLRTRGDDRPRDAPATTLVAARPPDVSAPTAVAPAAPVALPSMGPAPPPATTVSRAAPAPAPSPRPTPEPVNAQAHLERADALYEAGRFKSALAEARVALRADPGNADARSLIEDLEVELVAETALKRAREALARGDREAARREVREGLRVKPHDGRLTAFLRQLTP